MMAYLHLADDLKDAGKGSLFIIFVELDIEIPGTDYGRFQATLVMK